MNLLILRDGTVININISDEDICSKGEKKAYYIGSTLEWQFWQSLLARFNMDIPSTEEMFKRLKDKGLTPKEPITQLFYASFTNWRQFMCDLELKTIVKEEDEVILDWRSEDTANYHVYN